MENLRIIEGKNVDLISPFPLSEARRLFGWLHCYRTVTESDDTPQTVEEFIRYANITLTYLVSWGVIDKNHLTNNKHEAPLVGCVSFEPWVMPNGLARSGFFHVATSRRAWKARLIDEVGELILNELFTTLPCLLRVSSFMNERNAPARALAKRLGFKFEGLVEDAIQYNGKPQNLVYYGLTRRNYLCHKQCSAPPLAPLEVPLVQSSEVDLLAKPLLETV